MDINDFNAKVKNLQSDREKLCSEYEKLSEIERNNGNAMSHYGRPRYNSQSVWESIKIFFTSNESAEYLRCPNCNEFLEYTYLPNPHFVLFNCKCGYKHAGFYNEW